MSTPSTSARDQAVQLAPGHMVYSGGCPADGTGDTSSFVHPADGSPIATAPLGSAADVDDAVETARLAQGEWWRAGPSVRRDTLLALAATIRESAADLAALVTLEMGMPIKASKAGVLHAAEWFSYYAGMADKLRGSAPAVAPPGRMLNFTEHTPYGVVGAIIPWNGPMIALALKVAPALAAGNAVVLKPSEIAPFSSLRFADLAHRAGLPAGLLNVVAGGADAGARLAEHPDVGIVSFTGGNVAGRAVAATAAARHAPVILELGGKSASIVFDDVDVKRTAKLSLLLGAVQNSGQGCFLPTRVLVQETIYEEFVERLMAAAAQVVIGDPFDPAVTMGPVVNEAARARIQGVIDRSVSQQHGRLVSHEPAPESSGSHLGPAIFVDTDPQSTLAQEEVFGPVLAVSRFGTEEEAIEIANGTRFGLAGYVWTSDLARAHRVASSLEAGNVSINGMSSLPPNAEFLGWHASGPGSEGGESGFYEFLRTKSINVQL
jgi:aldehyde dehydrogenase (NAD+)